MATEYKLSYTASEIDRKLATVDETKSFLENNYYTSAEVNNKFAEVNDNVESLESSLETSIEEINSNIENSLATKADLVGGKIPTSQIPDDIGGDVAWEDIENKPFGEIGYQIEWDKTITDEYVEVAALGGSKWCKVYDYIEKTEVVGATLKTSDGESVLGDTDLTDYNEYCYGISGNPYFFITSQETTISAFGTEISFTSAGVWFIISPDGETYAYYLGKGEIKKLDKKFIPSEIGTWEGMLDKPFGESKSSITWDSTPTSEFVNIDGLDFYKVSDTYIDAESLIGSVVSLFIIEESVDLTEIVSSDSIMELGENGFAISSPNLDGIPSIIITSSATVIEGVEFPSSGIWFLSVPDICYASCLESVQIKKLDAKYLPDDIGGGASSWNDLKDKPFGEEGWAIEWDTNPTDTFVPIEGSNGFYKVSDIVPAKVELIGATLKAESDGESIDMVLSDSDIVDYSADCYGMANMPFFIVTTQATEFNFMGQLPLSFLSAGVWFIYSGGVSWAYYLGKGELKQLDPKFIPNYFGEVGTKIEWDGTPTSVYETFDMGGVLGYFYKVSEPVNTIADGIIYVTQEDGEFEQFLEADGIQITDGGENGFGMVMNVKVPNSSFDHPAGITVTFKEVGLYFFHVNMEGQIMGVTSFTSSDYGIKQIDKKYIPDDIVASVSLTFDEVPTEGSQNPVKSMGIHSAISALEGKITSTFCYKGTVENYSDLPSSDNTVGDVWNIANVDEANGVNAGDNAAWNGSSWDILAGVIDLSDYYTKTEIDSIALNGTVNLANYYTKAETYTKSEIDNMIGDCDTIISSINTLVGGGNV